MNKRRFWFWLSLPIAFVTVILLLYFGSYLICLHPASGGGGGSGQRFPAYGNPFTGRMLPHHLQFCYFFKPAQKIDALIRPGYWWWLDPAVHKYNVKASGEDAGWSKPVKGLRARLQILPSQKSDSPFCRVFIEFQNVDDVAGQKKIRFTPDKLALRVTDKSSKELSIANEPYDGTSPLWEPILLPYAGTLRFQISFPGLGYRPTDKVIIDVGSSKAWVVPQDGSTYYLSGSLSVQREQADHPYMDWNGTLDLPKVEIPKQK